ncbi:MAG: KOW domain-containing RNA-binding protein [Lachnospiraceae bacterium]|nr:KOW domain-containing RNA-binding protein [Lachnospiraceae bacterium]
MEAAMIGMLAVSKAGHDKRKIYVITGEDDEYVYLADGRKRTVAAPKKKNKKHIQIIRKIQTERPNDGYSDLEIKRTIKMYQEEANV